MIRRLAALACNRLADWLFLAGDRFVRLGFRLDPTNELMRALSTVEDDQATEEHQW
jgi:hypothetical protein